MLSVSEECQAQHGSPFLATTLWSSVRLRLAGGANIVFTRLKVAVLQLAVCLSTAMFWSADTVALSAGNEPATRTFTVLSTVLTLRQPAVQLQSARSDPVDFVVRLGLADEPREISLGGDLLVGLLVPNSRPRAAELVNFSGAGGKPGRPQRLDKFSTSSLLSYVLNAYGILDAAGLSEAFTVRLYPDRSIDSPADQSVWLDFTIAPEGFEGVSSFLDTDGSSDSELDELIEIRALASCTSELSRYWSGARLLFAPGAQSLRNIDLPRGGDINALQLVNVVVDHFRRDGSDQLSLSDDMSGERRVERPADARLLLRADIEDSDGNILHSAIQCDGSGDLSETEMCEYDPQQGTVGSVSVYFAVPALQFVGSASGFQIGERTGFSLRIQTGGNPLRMNLGLLYPDGANHPEERNDFTTFWVSRDAARQGSCALPTDDLRGARLNFRSLENEFCDLAVVGGAEGRACGLLAPIEPSVVAAFSPPAVWQATTDELGTGEALLSEVPANSAVGCISLRLPEGRVLSRLALRYSIEPAVPEHFQLLLESEGVSIGPFASAVQYDRTREWNSFEYRGTGQNPPVGATIKLCHAPAESPSSLRIDNIELETITLPNCASELPQYWDGARLLLAAGAPLLRNISLFGAEETNAVHLLTGAVQHIRGDGSSQLTLSNDMSGRQRVERPAGAELLLRADIEDRAGNILHSAVQCGSAGDRAEMCEYDPQQGTVGGVSDYFVRPALQFVNISRLKVGERSVFGLRVLPNGSSLRLNLGLLYPDGVNHPDTREDFTVFWSSRGFSGQESCALSNSNLQGARLYFRDLEGEFCDLVVVGGAEGTSCGLLAPIVSTAVVAFSPPEIWQVTADELGTGEALLRKVPANSADGCISLQLPEAQVLLRLAFRYSIEPAVPEHFQLRFESEGVLSDPIASVVEYNSVQEWNRFEYRGAGQNPPVGATIRLCHTPAGAPSSLRVDDIELETITLLSCASELSRYWDGARLRIGPEAQSLQSVSLFGTEETNAVQLVNAVVEHFRRDGSEQLSLSDDMSGDRRVERPADARLLLRADIEDSDGNILHSAVQCGGIRNLLETNMCEYDPQQGTVGGVSVYFARPALQFVGSASGLQIGERTEFTLRVLPGGGSLRMSLSLLYPDGVNHPDEGDDFTVFMGSGDTARQDSCALPTSNLQGTRLNFRDLEGEFCDLVVLGGTEGAFCGSLAPVPSSSPAVVAFSPPTIWQVTADEAGTGEALLREVPANSVDGSSCISLQLPEGRALLSLALRYSIEPAVPEHFQLLLESAGVLSGPFVSAVGYDSVQEWNRFEYRRADQNPPVGTTIRLCHAVTESTSSLRIDDIELETIVLPNCASELPRYWNGARLLIDPGAQPLQSVSLFGAEETNAVQTVNAVVEHFRGDGSEQLSLSDDISGEQRVERPADTRLLLRADIEDSSGAVVLSAIQCDSAEDDDLLETEMCEYDPQDGTVSTRALSVYFARPALQFVGSSGLQIGERTEFSMRVLPGGGSLRMSLGLLYPDGVNHPDEGEDWKVFWSSQGFSGQNSCALPTDDLQGARLNFRDLEGEFCDLAVVGGAEGASCGLLAPVPSGSPAVAAFSPPAMWRVTADESGTGEALLREVPANSAAGCISLQLPAEQGLLRLALRYSVEPAVPEHFQLRLESAGVLSGPIASAVRYDSTQTWNSFEYRGSDQNPSVGATIMLCHAAGESASSLRIDDIVLETTAFLGCARELSRYWDGARLLLDPGAQSLQNVSLFGAEETNAVQTVNAVVEHFRRDGSEQLSLGDDMSGERRVERPADARLLLRADIEDSSGTVVHSAVQCDGSGDQSAAEMCEYDPQQGRVGGVSVYFASPALQFGRSTTSGLQIGERTEFALRVQPSGGSLRMSLSLLYPDGDNHPDTREDFTVFMGSGDSARQENCALPTTDLQGARLNFRDLEGEFCDLAVVGGAEGTSCGLLAPITSTAVVAFLPPAIWQVTADELGTGEALLREVPANSAAGCISLRLPEGRVLSRLAFRYSIEPAVSGHFQLVLESEGVLIVSAVGFSSTQTWNSFEYGGVRQNPPVGATIRLCHAAGESASSLRIDDIELETLDGTALPNCASELPRYWDGARLLLDPGAQPLQSVSLFGAEETNAVQTVNAVVKHFRGDGSEQLSLSDDMSGEQRVERPADARLLLRVDIEDSSGTVVHSAVQCDGTGDLSETEMCEYDPQEGGVGSASVYFAIPALQFVGSASGFQIGERTEFALRVLPGGGSLRTSLGLLYPDGVNHPDEGEDWKVFWSSQGFSGRESCALPTDDLRGARLNFRDLEGEFCDLVVLGGAEGASCGLLTPIVSTAVVAFSPPSIWQVTADESGTGEALLREVPANSADGCIRLRLPEGQVLSRLALRYSIDPPVPEHFQLRLESAGVLSGPFASAVGYSSTQTWNRFEHRGVRQNPPVGATIMLCHAAGESTSSLRIDDIELETLERTALPNCAAELPQYWDGARLLLDPGAQSLRSVSLFGTEETNSVQTVNAVVEHFRRDGSEQLSLSDDMSGERRVERPADARLLLRADIEDSSGTVVHSAVQCDSAGERAEMCEYDPQQGTVGNPSVYFASPALEFVGSSTSGLQIGERTEFALRVQPSGGSLRMSLSLLYPDGVNHPDTRENFAVFWSRQGFSGQESCALPTDDLQGAQLNFRDLEGEFCDLAVLGGTEGRSCGLLAPVPSSSPAVVAFSPPTIWQVTADESGTGEALLREVPANSAAGCISLQLPEGQVLLRLALRYSIDPPVPEHFQLLLESGGVLSGPFTSGVEYNSAQEWNRFEYRLAGQNPPAGASIMLCHAPAQSTSSLRMDDIELETTELLSCTLELSRYWDGARLLLDPGAQSLQSVSLFGAEETNAVQLVNVVVKHIRGDGSEQLSLSDDMSGPQRVERPADARLLLRADIEDRSGTVVHSAVQCDGSGDLSQAEMCEYDPQQGTVSTRTLSVYFASPALQFGSSTTSGLQIGERTEFALRVQPSGGSLRMSLGLLYPDGVNHPDTRDDFTVFLGSGDSVRQENCALLTSDLQGARLNFRDLEGEFCDLAVVGGAEGTSCGLLAPVPSSSPAVVAFSPPTIWRVTADEVGTGEALLREVPANSAASSGCISMQLPEGRVLSRLALRYSIDPPVPEHFELRLESAGVLSGPFASVVEYNSAQEWNRFEYRGSGQNPPVGATIMLCHAAGESTSSLRIDNIELETLESTALPSCASELPEYWDGARLLLDPGAQSLRSVSLFGTEETNAVQTVNAVVEHFRRDGSEQRSLSDDMSGEQRVERPADARLLLRVDIEDSAGAVVLSAIQCDSAEDDDLLETEMCEYDPQEGTVSTRALSVYFARPALQFVGSTTSGLQIGERTEFALRVQPSGGSLRMSLSLLYPDGVNHPDTRENFAVFWSRQGFSGQESCALPTSNLQGARLNFRDLEGEFCDLAVVGGAEGASCGLLAPLAPDVSTAVVAFSPPAIWQVTTDELGTGEALLSEVPANSAAGCINLQLPEGQVLSRLALRYSIDPPVPEHFELRLESGGVLSGPFAATTDYDSAQTWNRFEYPGVRQNPPVGVTIMLCHAPGESASSLRIDDIELETLERTALPNCASELPEYWDGARLLLDPGAQSLRNVSLFGAEETNAVQTVNAVVEHFRGDGSEQQSLGDDMSAEQRVERPADARLLLRADIEDSAGTVVHSAVQCDSAGELAEMCEYDPQQGTVGNPSVYFASPALQFGSSTTSGLQIGERTEFALRVQPSGGSLRMSLSLLYPNGVNHPDTREDFTVFWSSQGFSGQESCALPTDDLEGARLNFRDLEGEFCDLVVVGGAEGTSCGLLAPIVSTAVVAFSPPAIWRVTTDESGTGEALLREVPENSAAGCISLQLPAEQQLLRLALRYSVDPTVPEHFELRFESEGVLSDPIASAVDYDSEQEWNRFEYRGADQSLPVGVTIMLCHASAESTSTASLRIDDIELQAAEPLSCASELPRYWDGARLLLDPGAQSLRSVSLFGTEETNAVQTVNAVVEHFRGDGSEQLSLGDDMSGERRVERPADARLLLRADIEDSSGTVVHSAVQCDGSGDLSQAEMCEYDPQQGTVGGVSVYFASPALQFGSSTTSGLQIGERTEFALRVQPGGGSLRMSLGLLYPDGVNHPDTREDFAIFLGSGDFAREEICALPTSNLQGARLNFRDLEGEFCDLAVVGGAEGPSCGLLAPVPSGSPAVVAFSPPSMWQVTADELGTGEALLRAVPANSADGCISLQLPEGQVLSRLALRYSIAPPVPGHFQLRLESEGVLSGPFASTTDYDSAQTWNRFEYPGVRQNPPVGVTIMLCHAAGESTSSLRIDDIELEALERTALPNCAAELPQYWDGARLLLDPGAQSLRSVSLFGAEETNAVQTVNVVVEHFRRDGSEQMSLSDDMSGERRVERPADARLLLRADIEDSAGTVVHSAVQCDSAGERAEMCEYDPQQGTVGNPSVYFASPALQFGSSTSGLQIGERTEFALRVQPSGGSLRMSLSLLYPNGVNHPDTREDFTVFWSSQGFSGQESCALPTDDLQGARLNFRDLEGEFCDLAVVGGAEGTSCGLLAPVPSGSPAMVAFSPPSMWQVTADESGAGEALLREVPANSAASTGCISLQLPEGEVLSRLALRYSVEPPVPEHFQLLLESAGVLSGPFTSAVGYSSTQTWNGFEYLGAGQNPPAGATIMLCHTPAESTSTLRIDDIELETLKSVALLRCVSELSQYWDGARLLLDPGAQSLQSVSLFGAEETNTVQTVNAVVKHFRRDGSEQLSLSDDILERRVERPADARLLLRADIEDSAGTVVHSAVQCDGSGDLSETEMCEYDLQKGTVGSPSVYFASPALQFGSSTTSGLQIGESTTFSLRVQPDGGSLRMSLGLLYPDGDNHPDTREEFTVFLGGGVSERCALPTSNLQGARLNFRDLEGEFCDLAVVGGAEGPSCGLLAPVPSSSPAVVAFSPPTIWQVTADELGTGEALLREVPANSADRFGCISLQLPEGRVLSRLALRYSIEPAVSEHFGLRLESAGVVSGPFASVVEYNSVQEWNGFEYRLAGQNPSVGATINLCHAPAESTSSSLRIDDIELETIVLPDRLEQVGVPQILAMPSSRSVIVAQMLRAVDSSGDPVADFAAEVTVAYNPQRSVGLQSTPTVRLLPGFDAFADGEAALQFEVQLLAERVLAIVFVQLGVAGLPPVIIGFEYFPEPSALGDIDGDGAFGPGDGVLMLRYLQSSTEPILAGVPLRNGVDEALVIGQLRLLFESDLGAQLDVDSSGSVDMLDIRILLRYMAGLRGTALGDDAVEAAVKNALMLQR